MHPPQPHHDHGAHKSQVALVSIFASAGLVVTKFGVALLTGSLALLTEALHSLMDLGATIITYFAVRLADRPADTRHHYGHGKIESLAALFEVVLLLLIAGFAIFEAVKRLVFAPEPVVAPPVAIAILIVSIVVDFFRARALQKAAKETSSQALEADSLHFVSDMWASIAALLGLVGIALGYPQADALAALAVAGIILSISVGLFRRTVHTLLDTAPEGSHQLIERLIDEVSGVVGVERVRLREVGAQTFCDVTIKVARTLPLQRVEEIKKEVADTVRNALPRADLALVTEPVALADESIMEQVMLIAARQRVFVHHLSVQQYANRLAIALDLELDETMPLAKAHETATRFELAIAREFGPETEVETHIEPLESLHDIQDVSEGERSALENRVKEIASSIKTLSNVHSLRARRTKAGRIVVLHCHMPGDLSVRHVHQAVDELERALRVTMPDIVRVLIHAEPDNVAQHHH